jgi:dolichol-phosphate mannosyltransferase
MSSFLRYDAAERPASRSLRARAVHAGQLQHGHTKSAPGREGKRKARASLSVVVPARNEASSLPQLIEEIARALRPLCTVGLHRLSAYEIIVVDDGSTDDTRAVLHELAAVYPELRAMSLGASAGQSSAIIAGIRAARGRWIATLDADLQNDPADLVRLWNALPGHDAALGWRVTRRSEAWRRVLSRWANRVRNALLGQSIRDTGCSVRIFPRARALRLPAFRGMHRFFGPLLLREGCRLVQVPVNDRPRPYGRSHYNLLNRSIHVVVDLFGVAWLLRRPVECQEVQIWSSRETRSQSECSHPGPNRITLLKKS